MKSVEIIEKEWSKRCTIYMNRRHLCDGDVGGGSSDGGGGGTDGGWFFDFYFISLFL